MEKLRLIGITSIVYFVFCAAAPSSSAATGITTLVNFDLTDGADPEFVPLVQGFDGSLYGTTVIGGQNGYGTIFKVTAAGTLTTLYSFCSQPDCADGSYAYGGLVEDISGDFYGTTFLGGANGDGTVYKITPEGVFTTLHSFDGTDGENPFGGLVQGADGNFYGTTSYGADTAGTVYKMTASGTLTTLHSFDCNTDGCFPYGSLIQATNGSFYGVTFDGGATGYGTVYKVTSAGKLTTLYSFCSQDNCTDGSYPYAGLLQASNGRFYGTTSNGGNRGFGTVFSMTSSGQLSTLHSFCSQTNCADGGNPTDALVQGTDGNIYGTTGVGGNPTCFSPNGCGTIFKITPAGTLSTLYSFAGGGGDPSGALVQGTNGSFYGTTVAGGSSEDGSVFQLSVGLGPFVKTVPRAGKVGAGVIILGSNLTGATSVTFNGPPATFSVVSRTYIEARVPAGATSGMVEVKIPSGTLSSYEGFVILP